MYACYYAASGTLADHGDNPSEKTQLLRQTSELKYVTILAKIYKYS